MKIKITQEHIDKGVKCNSDYCPIALAIKEQKPELNISVMGGYINVCDNVGIMDTVFLPEEAAAFVMAFDDPRVNHPEVEPFEFEVFL